ncbi:MAG TPA: hypothetical protein HA354_06085 [Candidatus Poseidoniaceae archaeon]|nr:MAG TPA: hypothetical protein D7I07_06060 [Candidatus Poseidoniales archaeon]HII38049.1 hypothetical protein [Candidatus Poseidoniaceae archaeon]
MVWREGQEPKLIQGIMADGGSSIGGVTFAIIVTFCLISLSSFVSASGDGVVIADDSINISDFQTTDDSYVELMFNLTSNDYGNSNNYIGEVYVETLSIEGVLLTNISYSFDLAEGASQAITANLSGLNYGYTTISASLSGDVGIESGNNVISFQRTVHRLKPLNVSIASASSIIVESIDSNKQPTGNSTLSDGDFVQLQIPIINSGDYPWNGQVNVTMNNGNATEFLATNQITIGGMNTSIVYFNSTIQALEGSFSASVSLDGAVDSLEIDNYRNITVFVGPPPLPVLNVMISYDNQSLESGTSLIISLTSFNNGSVGFSGSVSCAFNNEELFNSTIELASLSSSVNQFTITVRPGYLVCSIEGQRFDSSSTYTASAEFSVESALFEYAGGSTPISTDGPWHVGDESTFSLLVRNTGTKTGSVSLRMTSTSGDYIGTPIQLGSDEAGEITVTVSLSNSVTENFNWSLYTIDGEVSGDISGQVSLPVAPRQNYELSIYDVGWTVEDGVTASWLVNLSTGINREINLKLGYGSNGDDQFSYDVNMEIAAGSTNGEINFGHIVADYVIIRADEVNWTAESSFSSFTKSIPQERPEYTITFNSLSTPNRPVNGQTASVSVVLQNDGAISGASGTIILYDKDGYKLAESPTKPLVSGGSETIAFDFVWPSGDEVKLNCKWDYGTESILIDKTFLSSITTSEQQDGFAVPWSGILGGFAIASLIILVLRIRNNADQPKNKRESIKVSKSKQLQLSDVKIEIACPICSRQLRVPENYEGSVRCPDCAQSFDVGQEPETPHEEEEVMESNDGKMEISCPECSQSLRIPNSYKGSVRCPACKTVFSSAGI